MCSPFSLYACIRRCKLKRAHRIPCEVVETAVKIIMYIASAEVYLTGLVAGPAPLAVSVLVP